MYIFSLRVYNFNYFREDVNNFLKHMINCLNYNSVIHFISYNLLYRLRKINVIPFVANNVINKKNICII